MKTISLKIKSSDTTLPLLKNAIDREKRIIMESLRITKDKVKKLSESLGVNVNKLINGKVKHTEINDMALIELEGEVEIMKRLEKELKEFESIKICK
ncbi:MAG: hypothetical protein A2149_05145 [Candidatus Schekmanbacteria bacterium RBG_16_38_11]|uniref:Uncharacterized protein n=2 Tax=Candidatus Schekmaniibacteriota TaxID=1817811 RepID=A0A1F7RP55_9BACT|nr:MAG: hypothetical protein A2042_09500 [Candidatus Schekmanbacteria bacterium GWA2_38_11]OGL43900.1 MAG: hypothetical protein A2149_05145 [Candidatus Schekmanbacteria bacterium RBG_16_38_11]